MASDSPADPGRALTPIDQAFKRLLSSLPAIEDEEALPLDAACGRILVRDLTSGIDVPPHHNSAMDGYALRAGDLAGGERRFKVSQRIPAGQTGQPLGSNEAARIFTGAPLPPGADAVVMQENCRAEADWVTVLEPVQAQENVRAAGEDIRAGEVLLMAGRRLRPQDIGLAASIGLTELPVCRRLRVAVLATGNELVPPGQPLEPGQIYNSNLFSLAALLQQLGALVEPIGVIEDDLATTTAALEAAAGSVDCLISTGGVSVGEEDYVKAAVEALGQLDLWKLAIKPGKPFASGKVGGTQFFGLPGNPVSAFVTFVLLVKPCLLHMQGCAATQPRSHAVRADFACPATGERQEYRRVIHGDDPTGSWVRPFDNQSSGVGASLSVADGLAIIPPHTAVKTGDVLQFLPFSELLA